MKRLTTYHNFLFCDKFVSQILILFCTRSVILDGKSEVIATGFESLRHKIVVTPLEISLQWFKRHLV